MEQYETAFLISPTLEEEETEKIITQMAEVISEKKGKMIKEDRWGKRRLAYQIKKHEEAFYVFFHYEGDSAIPNELERRFKQSEAILRFLTVKKEIKENVRKKRKEVSPPVEVQKPSQVEAKEPPPVEVQEPPPPPVEAKEPSEEEEKDKEEDLAQEVLPPAKKTEEEESNGERKKDG
ncbi:MAG: 30S ribosomal protein S6 [Candidatus Aminicenantes bacterium]|nr:30S ribosomal protein S6 [Candidatus Aminicenantes bacterium]